MRRLQRMDSRLIGLPARNEELHLRRAVFQEQPMDFLVAKLPRHLMRRNMPAERPLIDRPAGSRVDFRKIMVIHARSDAVRRRNQMPSHQDIVSERGGQEDIRAAPVSNEETNNLLAV